MRFEGRVWMNRLKRGKGLAETFLGLILSEGRPSSSNFENERLSMICSPVKVCRVNPVIYCLKCTSNL